MRQLFTIYCKEVMELWRNFKWIWVPLVFIFLGVMQPITTFYMPEILDAVGGLPEGSVIEIPLPSGGEVLAKTLSQYGTMGILILVLCFMGIVSAERESGVVSLIMIKPVSHTLYITAKWLGAASLTFVSFLFGYLASWYYTNLLIEKVQFFLVVKSFFIYLPWLLFVITVTLFVSTYLKGSGAIAFLSLSIAAGFFIVTSFLSQNMGWSPAMLPSYSTSLIVAGQLDSGLFSAVLATFVMIVVLIVGAIAYFKSTFHMG